MSYSFWEVVHRAKTGPIVSETDFDLKILVPKLREVAKKYNVKYDPDNPVTTDEELVERVFKAALEFYCAVGVYCTDTGRIIKFNEDEVLEAIQASPRQVFFGEGRDRVIMKYRQVEDKEDPTLWLTAFSLATNEELYGPIVESFIQEPLADIVSTPNIKEINRIPCGAGDPTEYLGATRLALMFNDARKRAGRPGIAIGNAVSTAVTAAGILAATRPGFGLRPSDGYYTPAISEFKIDMDRLTRNAFMLDWNANIIFLFSPILGGMCGGPDTLAVANVAYYLMGATLCKAHCFATFPIHFSFTNTTHRPTIWATSLSQQAVSRYTHLVSVAEVFTRNGPATPEIAYELVAWALATVPCGANLGAVGFGGGGDRMFNYCNPLDARLVGEAALGAVSLTRNEANQLVDLLIKKYELSIDENFSKGKHFIELYNPEARQPLPEAMEHYLNMKSELSGLGIKFKNR